MRSAPCNSSEFSLFRIFFNLLHYRQMELCIPQFFEEVGLFVISRSTVQIRVLAPEKSMGYIKRCNPFLVTVRTAFLRLGNFASPFGKIQQHADTQGFPSLPFFLLPFGCSRNTLQSTACSANAPSKKYRPAARKKGRIAPF